MTDSNVVQIPPAADKDKRRTVTLTNHRPVSFVESEWPVVAEGKHEHEPEHGGEVLQVSFRVRMNKHGRYLIHGKFYYWNDLTDQPESVIVRVGRLLALRDDESRALAEVGEEMRVRVLNEYMHRWVRIALDDCFAKLGPQVL